MKQFIGGHMLCERGCGQEAKYITATGKQYCCQSWTQCPVGRKRRSETQTTRMKDPNIRVDLSKKITDFVNVVDPTTGHTLGQIRMSATQEKTMSTIDLDSGLTMSKIRTNRAMVTRLGIINPNTGKNMNQEQSDRMKQWAAEIDPITGETNAKRNGRIGGSTRKNKINPNTGVTIAKEMAQKRLQTEKQNIDINGVNGTQRRNRKAAMTKQKTIDPDTGLSVAQLAGHKSRETKLSTINGLGQDGYEQAEAKCKLVQYYKHTNLFFQGSYERQFIEEKEREFGSLELLTSRITRGPNFNYLNPTTKQYHTYRSDFLQDNKIVYEIKSTFVMGREGGPEVLKSKLLAAENAGYKTELILDYKCVDWKTSL